MRTVLSIITVGESENLQNFEEERQWQSYNWRTFCIINLRWKTNTHHPQDESNVSIYPWFAKDTFSVTKEKMEGHDNKDDCACTWS